jgi:hypothetical protein
LLSFPQKRESVADLRINVKNGIVFLSSRYLRLPFFSSSLPFQQKFPSAEGWHAVLGWFGMILF